jgi:glutathione synthase/RimK-type ligase-like ATP-grasp enzyme
LRHEGDVIAKPVRSGYIEVAEGRFGIYTRRLTPRDIELLETAIPCPIIVQREIPKEFDIRATVVGRKVFAVAIDSQTDPEAKIDWRRTENPDLPHQIHKLPGRMENLLITLTHELGLSFAAIDLILSPDGEYFFLEVNPSGQWLWVEDKTGLPISDAVADWLEGV